MQYRPVGHCHRIAAAVAPILFFSSLVETTVRTTERRDFPSVLDVLVKTSHGKIGALVAHGMRVLAVATLLHRLDVLFAAVPTILAATAAALGRAATGFLVRVRGGAGRRRPRRSWVLFHHRRTRPSVAAVLKRFHHSSVLHAAHAPFFMKHPRVLSRFQRIVFSCVHADIDGWCVQRRAVGGRQCFRVAWEVGGEGEMGKGGSKERAQHKRVGGVSEP